MQIKIKYFYTNDKEMKRGDTVYLEGVDVEGLEIKGVFQVGYIDENTLAVYSLEEDKEACQAFHVWIDSMNILKPVEHNGLYEKTEEAK